MKKQNLSSLVLRKNKVSNLNKLSNLVGGSETVPPPTEEVPSTVETYGTYCGSCYECASLKPSDCQTNDTIRSLGNPTIMNTSVNITGVSGVDC